MCFLPNTSQADYTLPTFANSQEYIEILNAKFEVIYKQSLVNLKNGTLLYRVYKIDKTRALDIAVLKLIRPAKEIQKNAIPFSKLDTIVDIYTDVGIIQGYPGKGWTFHSMTVSIAAEIEQIRLLEEASKYYYLFRCDDVSLSGMSGGPILIKAPDGSTSQVVGIFTGQNKKYKSFGYGIFSYYIRAIINNYN